jgi:hypothetical protein
MNTPEYRKAYMANLKMETNNNNKNLVANKGNPSAQQYITNSGQQVLGISRFTPTNVQAKGTKFKGFGGKRSRKRNTKRRKSRRRR